MKIKRYEAENFQKALEEVKRDLGSEAVILQTRRFVKGGFLGMMGKGMVEVLATTDARSPRADGEDEAPARRAAPAARPEPQIQPPPPPPRKRAILDDPPPSVEIKGVYGRPAPISPPLSELKFNMEPEEKPKASAPAQRAVAPMAATRDVAMEELKSEIREVRTALKLLAEKDRWSARSAAPAGVPYPGLFGEVYLKLLEQEVEPFVTQDILRFLDDSLEDEDKANPGKVQQALRRHLMRRIKTSGQIEVGGRERRVVALVGPTGSGKTTTLAKLASHYALNDEVKVGVVTADTYRIAAVEQLKVYGDILDMPVKVVYNSADMKRVLDQYEDKDLVLIDTAGRSHKDGQKIKELEEILSACYPLDIHLALSANTRFKDMVDIAEKFRAVPVNHFLFTKLDETSTYGCLFSLICKHNMGVSYITNGQSVPEDIRAATPEGMLELLMGAK